MEVYSGILTVKTASLLKTKMFSNFWCILYNGRIGFSPRLDLYEDKAHVGQISCMKTIYIEEAKWKRAEPLEPAFSFEVKHNKKYIFITPSISELRLWILILCCVSKDLFDTRFITGIEDFCRMDSNYLTEDVEEIVTQENILYSNNNDLSTFKVLADQIEGCLQNGFKGLYQLHIDHAGLHLLELDSEEVTCWSLHQLKNFGHSPRTFFLQCGSRSLTGAGKFIFHTTEGERITQRLNLEVQSLHNQSYKSGKPPQMKGVAVMSGSQAQHGTVRSKPPAPPSKPKSINVKRSSNENDQLQPEDVHLNESRVSKKGTPAFGVPVFVPLTTQTSNLKLSDNVFPPVDKESCKRESFNGLHHVVENDTKQALFARSESCASETGSRKDSKKMQKEFKKEQKRKMEEEKKERKRIEEEKKKEQKRKEEEEKKIKKEQKKSKQKAGRTLSSSSQSVSVSHSDITSEYTEADFSTYTEVNVASTSPHSHILAGTAYSEKIYSEPWGPFPVILMPPEGSINEVEYAQPEKRPHGNVVDIESRDIVHSENYEECLARESEHNVPGLNPPDWEQEEDDSKAHLYSHLNQSESVLMTQENVYGMASASAPAPVSEEENPYEDTSIPA